MAERQSHPLDKKSDPKSPNVRSASMRKTGKDGGFTPTELRKRDTLMKQFAQRNKGYGIQAVSPEYAEGWERIFGKKGE